MHFILLHFILISIPSSVPFSHFPKNLTQGLNYLKRKDITFRRDLELSNFLLKMGNGGNLRLKLVDFGDEEVYLFFYFFIVVIFALFIGGLL